MHLALGSAFRNFTGYRLNQYFRQVARLADDCKRHDHHLHLKLIWGDCADDTRDQLSNYAQALLATNDITSFELSERSHGGPVFGSTEEPARMKALSYVGNGVLETVGPGIDALIYVESDLLWESVTFQRLLARMAKDPNVHVVAPLIFAGAAFYDIWGFRSLEGERFGPFFPFSRDLKFNGDVTEVGSVGSCLVMRGEVARNCRIRNDGALVDFCTDARAQGYRIWVDPKEQVNHP